MALTTEQIELAKELIPGIEVTAETTTAQLKAMMGEKFIDMELHKEATKKAADTAFVTGRGKAENAMKRILGEAGKGKAFDELVEALEADNEDKSRKIKELEVGNKGGKNDAEIEKLTKEKKALEEMLETANKENGELKVKVESAEQDKQTALYQEKLNVKVRADFGSIAWIEKTNDYTKKGIWDSEVDGKYTFKLEDDFVYDQQGDVVKDPAGTGKLTRKSLFESLADKAGCLIKNGAQPHIKKEGRKPENLTAREEKHFNLLEELKAKQAPKA